MNLAQPADIGAARLEGISMRRVMLLLALALIVSACAGAAQDGGSAEDTGPATTAAETTTTAPAATTTTAAPATTTTVADQSLESTFATAAFTPPDVFESYVSEVVMTIALGEGGSRLPGKVPGLATLSSAP
jgi:hypothetical protein